MNNLRPIAQAVQSQGRGKDTQLIHMTPNEVQGLQALAKAHGGSLSINPSTGLPEAGFLDSMLPTILGIGLAAATGGTSLALTPGMIGLGIGGLQWARTGSLEKGLMAGLGAYGGAGLGSSLMGAGATGAANAANVGNVGEFAGATPPVGVNSALANASSANTAAAAANAGTASTAATQEAAKIASQNLATEQGRVAAANTFGQNLSNMGEGLKLGFKSPTNFMDMSGKSGMDLARYAGAAASGPLTEPPEQKKREVDDVRFEYDYNANPASKEDLAQQRRDNPYGELTYFNPSYGERREVKVGAAQGGIMGLANGGSTDTSNGPSKYSYDPKTQTYKRLDDEILKTDKPVGAVESLGVNDRSGSGGDSQDTGGAYWADYEAKNGKEATLAAQAESRKALPEMLAKAVIPGLAAIKGLQDFFDPPTKSYSKSWNEMTPAEKGYTVDNQAPVTNDMVAEAEANDGGKNAAAAAALEAQGITITDFGGSGDAVDPGFGDGFGYGMGFAEGGALRFAQGDVVPSPDRIYPEPVVTPAPQLIPAQTSQGLAAAALQQQQLANQANQFVAPNAMLPQQQTFAPATGIASGYAPNRAADYTAATPATFQAGLTALAPTPQALPGGFSGYGDQNVVRTTPRIPTVPGSGVIDPNDGNVLPPIVQRGSDRVVDLYDSLLGRSSDTGGLNYWTNTIGADGVITDQEKRDFVNAAVASGEINPLQAFYATDLDRSADEAGLKYWESQGFLDDNVIDKNEQATILTAAAANKEISPLEAFYRNPVGGLGRTPDEGGLKYWESQGFLADGKLDEAEKATILAAARENGENVAKGGIIGLAAGGMARGGFVFPADVVSALGNGSTDAGLRKLMAKIGAVQPIKGKGDGLSDSIPTNIDGRQPARVADGEAYVDPRTVAKIGGGDAKKGAKKLYAMMDKIRMQAHGKKTQQRKVNDKAVV